MRDMAPVLPADAEKGKPKGRLDQVREATRRTETDSTGGFGQP
jgi:hypothetical protein